MYVLNIIRPSRHDRLVGDHLYVLNIRNNPYALNIRDDLYALNVGDVRAQHHMRHDRYTTFCRCGSCLLTVYALITKYQTSIPCPRRAAPRII
ncbi:hypothetical protein EX895_001531 [Sporisorium graminicola]|uniref:Uncharacterized protein n=1 Tax=Sporisorium graminicola TaxID=280036 RepID=A0A4U7KZC0_9BASI|nr:hypothetical protein EX895_001531 [Sporisorium graminicola]TKY89746.1 hypothetical protein EX895_001531 [Sporisorium graminicola]